MKKKLDYLACINLILPLFIFIVLVIVDTKSSLAEKISSSATFGLFIIGLYTFIFKAGEYLINKGKEDNQK